MEEIEFRENGIKYWFPTRWLSEYRGFATWISAIRRANRNLRWGMDADVYVATERDIIRFIAVVKHEEKHAQRAQQAQQLAQQQAQQQAQQLAQQQAQQLAQQQAQQQAQAVAQQHAQQQAQPLIPRPPRGLCTRIGGCVFGYRANNHNDRARTRKARAQRKKTRRVR